jgi:N6-L-threonylcarbamoyladenine synthase
MHLLGIETSCDETAAAVVEDGQLVRSNVISSQYIHSRYGGVVPELASRAHIKLVTMVVTEALEVAKLGLGEIDAVAVTYAPGLIGSLLVGVNFAKAVARVLDVPLIGVNHLEGHVFSIFLSHCRLESPFVCLIASGGHTELLEVNGRLDYSRAGSTRDDAAGETFDKGAKILGLGYPGGPAVERLAEAGDPCWKEFPRPKAPDYDFSFSGLKTSLLYFVQDLEEEERETLKAHMAASFQEAICDSLATKTLSLARDRGIARIAVAGGVARNRRLKEVMEDSFEGEVYFPSPQFCTDNAAMIAACGYERLSKGERSPLTLSARSRMKIA